MSFGDKKGADNSSKIVAENLERSRAGVEARIVWFNIQENIRAQFGRPLTQAELEKASAEHLAYRKMTQKFRLELKATSLSIEAAEKLLQPRVTRPPAARLVGLFRLVFTRKAFEHVFSQVILDGREEYYEALSDGKIGLARFRAIRLYGILLFAVVVWAASGVLHPIAKSPTRNSC
ncbi:hypothetical protein [Oricola indica]|uniref:hypothetical protein n=1 Tax=Oricola indica TaxID=2872591 RepID=UPI003CCC3168